MWRRTTFRPVTPPPGTFWSWAINGSPSSPGRRSRPGHTNGSTAYSLAAGGAIVSPNAEVFTLTPICPHTLSNRSVIVNLNSVVQVKVLSQRVETVLSADGQVQTQLAAGDTVTIRRSQRTVRLVHLAGNSFFETLRQKLHWSGSTAQ